MIILTATAAFGFGLVAGLITHYLLEYRPLYRKHIELIDVVVSMKKQGFVPQFAIEQKKEIDLTEKEY
jgi:hypothetical protein